MYCHNCTNKMSKKEYSPVVIVPGTVGNQLEAKLHNKPTKPAWYCYCNTDTWFTLWLKKSSLLTFQINCWVDNMRLDWDMKDMTVKPPPGVLTRVPGFGSTKTIETLDKNGVVKYMKPLLDYMKSLGYTCGKDLHGAPYDFRYSPENLPHNFHTKLKALIEETFTSNDNKKVSIISHCFGSIVTQYFLLQQSKDWKNKYLKQWISLAGPFGGTKQQLHLYSSGYLEGQAAILIDRLKLRAEQRSSTSNLWMLPSLIAWPAADVIVKTNKRQYTMADIDDFLADVGFPEGIKMRHHISNSLDIMSKGPDVPMHCFYGHVPESTIDQLEFDKDEDFPDNPSIVVLGDGDGMVNTVSLSLCKDFTHLQEEVVSVTEVEGAKHMDILSNKTVLHAIGDLLQL